MLKFFKLLILAVPVLVACGAVAGATELMVTDPKHYANPSESLQGGAPSLTSRTKQPRGGSHVVVRDPGALLDSWRLNKELSRACNHDQFRQKRDQYLIGIVGGQTYGAAVGGQGSLIDRGKLAENQVIYLFRGQGTTECRVYHRTK